MAPYYLTSTAFCLAVLVLHNVDITFARVNLNQMSRQGNQYFLNEFCDLESKTIRSARKLKNQGTLSVFPTPKHSDSSLRVLPSKQQIPSSFSFGFGNNHNKQVKKQLNCSINVVAPKDHGLIVTINSFNMPKNLTKLDVTLNHNSTDQTIHIDSGNKTDYYLLAQQGNSKVGIHLQSFQPIDWSTLQFDILFTVYRRGNSTGPNSNWFDCGDNIYVPSSLVCDKNKNCPNGSDEGSLYYCYKPLIWSIVTSTILSMVLIILIIIVILTVRRRRLPDIDDDEKFSYVFETDGVDNIQSSQIDLTLENAALHNGYLTNNVYAGGFENPIWTNGTLTKHTTNQH